MPGVKRPADYQLTSENHDDEVDESYETTPNVASKEELSKRRLLKVRQDAYTTGSSQTTASSTGGLFKNLLRTAPGPAPVATSFGFGTAFSSKITQLDATAHTDSAGIGLKPEGKLPGGVHSDAAVAAAAPTFTFGAKAPSPGATETTTTPPSFSFSFGTAAAGVATGGIQRDGPSEGSKVEQKSSHLFAADTFSFAGAVKSFVDARKKFEEDRKNGAQKGGNTDPNSEDDDAHVEAKDHKDGDTAEKFESHSIVARSGEVLASAPCKLFLFDSKEKKWLDRGESEAKVKREHYNEPETADSDAQDNTGKEDDKNAPHCYRLLVRNGYSLNSLIGKNVFVLGKEGPKHIVFSVSIPEGGIANYLLKFTGPNGESNTKKFLEEIRKVMSASEQ